MKKPTVYLDTNIISAYWHEAADVLLLARRFATRDWWEKEREFFSVVASNVTEGELEAGVFPRQSDCLKMVRRLRYLPVTSKVHELAARLLAERIIPKEKPVDALQLAVAVAHQVDYLLTWNYAHLANPTAQQKVANFCRLETLKPPSLVSPESIPKALLGQSIRRPK